METGEQGKEETVIPRNGSIGIVGVIVATLAIGLWFYGVYSTSEADGARAAEPLPSRMVCPGCGYDSLRPESTLPQLRRSVPASLPKKNRVR